jgi:hypothetical protein
MSVPIGTEIDLDAQPDQLGAPILDGDPVARDARTFGSFAASGGWLFGLMVARSVVKGGKIPRTGDDDAARGNAIPESWGAGKVSFRSFAEQAGCDPDRVSRYLRAWERAADDGVVPPAEELLPGQETVLPDPELWASYYAVREVLGERRERLAVEAETIGTSFAKTMEITANRPALRAAILGDPATARAAQEALLERPQSRLAVIAQAMADPEVRKEAAAGARRAERVEFVQRILAEGKARTSGGQIVEVDVAAAEGSGPHLTAIADPAVSAEEVTEAYEFVRDVISQTVNADPDILIREQRTRFGKALSATAKSLQAIDPDDLLAVADDTLLMTLTDLRQRVNELADLVVRPPARQDS